MLNKICFILLADAKFLYLQNTYKKVAKVAFINKQ